MFGKARKVFSIIIITALVLMNANLALASSYSQSRSVLRKANLSFEGSFTVPQKDKSQLSEARKKLSTDLLSLVDESFIPSGQTILGLKRQMQGNGQFRHIPNAADSNSTEAGQVYVYIYLKHSAPTSVVDSFVSVKDRDEKNHYVVGWVNESELDSLAALQDVRSIRTVLPPVIRTGSVDSEGDVLMNVYAARSVLGGVYDGTGIKVGIISDGVTSIADSVYSGDLPDNVTVVSASYGNGDEGTAMLEIVHDLAPGAELYFHDCGSNTTEFNQAIDALVSAGCNIICDDIGWMTEPFFEDGPVASHVASVIAGDDVLYVSAAGNDALSHYQGMYKSYQSSLMHDFSGNGTDPVMYVNIPAGGTVDVILQWNDQWGSSGNDYDMLLVDATDPSTLLAGSTRPQDGTGDPIEVIDYTNNTGADIVAAIEAGKYDASAADKTLELYIYGTNGAGNYSDNVTPEDSIYGHAAVSGVVTVGAVNTSKQIEDYSSQGPVTLYNGIVRSKPEVCGIDGVAITGAGGFPNPFYGTSAAAPHVAAVAALAMERNPSLTASGVAGIIESYSNDLGAPGYDNVYGYGLPDALNMVNDTDLGQLSFSSAGYSVGEGVGSVSISVYRTSGSSGMVTVGYATSNGSATAGSDYTSTSGILTFNNGDTTKSFIVPVLDNSVYKSNETVNLSLSTPGGGATLGSQPSAVLTIVDNDSPPSGGSSSPSGGGGTPTQGTSVSAGGGTVTESGVTIVVPAGAVDEEIKVQVEKVTSVSGLTLPKNGQLVSQVVNLVKDISGNFNKPVTITMSFDKSKVDPDQYTVSIYWYDESSGKWVELDNVKADMTAGTVSGEVSHFTKFAVIAVKNQTIPSLPPVLKNDVTLKDIAGHWAEANIKSLVASGAISGYPDGTFRPDGNITRAEFATVLVKALGLKAQGGKVFKDTTGHWAKDFISTAAALGIVNGYPEGNFGPDDLITREQMAAMTVKAAGLTGTSRELTFADTKDISDWALEAISIATGKGIMKGYPGNTVRPGGNATRAEAVTVILNALNNK